MRWIYLSPHLDDAVLSCGGIIWEQIQQGDQVEVWTIFAGDPPPGALPPLVEELHTRWQTGESSSAARRLEDAAACAALGAAYRHFQYPDCIYRRLPGSGEPVIRRNDDLFTPIQPGEEPLVDEIASLLGEIPTGAQVVSPLTAGGHVDHRIVRGAAQKLSHTLWFYADFPYAGRHPGELADLLTPNLQAKVLPVSPAGLSAWQRAVAAYTSQLSTFWGNIPAMEEEVARYCRGSGCRLWLMDSR